MNRRQFLGAAAAATGLSIPDDEQPAVDVSRDDLGSACASVEPGDPVAGTVHFAAEDDPEADLSVKGYAYDDEQSMVECFVSVGSATITLSFSPERAEGIAAELMAAAEFADEES